MKFSEWLEIREGDKGMPHYSRRKLPNRDNVDSMGKPYFKGKWTDAPAGPQINNTGQIERDKARLAALRQRQSEFTPRQDK